MPGGDSSVAVAGMKYIDGQKSEIRSQRSAKGKARRAKGKGESARKA